ncbi:MAG: MFS transporter [Elusimicrobia bacterium]|nr:MFS transporter [Elusimicrobiota bacterium]
MIDLMSAYSKRVLILIFSISLFNYIDRQILYAVFPLVKKDLVLSDTELGFLASAFMVIYMCAAPFIAYFGDRRARPVLIGLSAIFWSIATGFSGLVKNYSQLLFARSAVGIGEAGYGTISPSYLAEWFPLEKRARVMAVYALGIPVGSAIGYILGGVLGQSFGWRNAFLIVAVPGALLGTAVMFLKESGENRSAVHRFPLKDYLVLLKNKTFLLTSFSQAIATFSIGGLAAWMPSYFVRNFEVSVARAGLIFGGVTVVAGVLGNFIGGWTADWLRKKNIRGYFIVGYLSFFISVPFGVLCVLSADFHEAILFLFIAEVFVFAHSGPYHAAIVEVTPSNMRSMAFAMDIFIIHAFGDAVSPVIIGYLSDLYGLKFAVFVCILFVVLGGVTSIFAGREYVRRMRDESEG